MFVNQFIAYLDPNMLGPQVQALAPWLAALLGAGIATIGFCWRSLWSFVCLMWGLIIKSRLGVALLILVLVGTSIGFSLFFVNWGRTTTNTAASTSDNSMTMENNVSLIPSKEEPAMRSNARTQHKVIVLGMDGLDPELIGALMKAGELPHFQALSDQGMYQPLATVTPPESPVVWSSFATGLDPADHGIFDFIHRDPGNYTLDLSITHITESGYASLRGGKAFWEKLSEAGLRTTVLFAPCDFPPKPVNGLVIAGMGVPDLQGLMGKYAIITTDPTWSDRQINGEVIGVARNTSHATFQLKGPRSFKKRFWELHAKNEIVKVDLIRTDKGLDLHVQDQEIKLSPGEWSDWVQLKFGSEQTQSVHGICRFYLTSLNPELQLYCSPIQVDPLEPDLQIAYPIDGLRQLAQEVGRFATLGLPSDTKAYEEGAIDAAGFLKQADSLIAENRRILLHQLDHQEQDFVFAYFNTPDPVQHMFWEGFLKERLKQQGASSIPGPIRQCYQQMDEILGEVQSRIANQPDTTLIVLSDHGFADFRRSVELNRVLADLGYLKLKPSRNRSGPLFEAIDWAQTRAYACGFTSVYLNLQGREKHGVVTTAESEVVLASLCRDFAKVVDPETQIRPITATKQHVSTADHPYHLRMPDLTVGYAPGYRVNWMTALGGVADKPYEPNTKRWKGDHIINPENVPGIFLMNRTLDNTPVRITDVSDFVLGLYQIKAIRESETASR